MKREEKIRSFRHTPEFRNSLEEKQSKESSSFQQCFVMFRFDKVWIWEVEILIQFVGALKSSTSWSCSNKLNCWTGQSCDAFVKWKVLLTWHSKHLHLAETEVLHPSSSLSVISDVDKLSLEPLPSVTQKHSQWFIKTTLK